MVDAHGMAPLDACGVDNVWPHNRAVAEGTMNGLASDVVHTLVRGNAIRVFGLEHVKGNVKGSLEGS